MSKFFYRGTPDVMNDYGKSGYNTKSRVKAGTQSQPLALVVMTEQRKAEVQAIVDEHGLVATIDVNGAAEENIKELDAVLHTPKTQRVEKTPERNDPCSCGSGKKYKKCCG